VVVESVYCYNYFVYLQRRGNKYNAKKTTYNGHVYHSAKEADYAEQLDWRLKAGELKEWQRQVPIDLSVNGQRICTYVIDFWELDKNDNEMWTEIKGFETSEWRFKWALFDAIHPDWEKQVIK
jgi:hypothetical protein